MRLFSSRGDRKGRPPRVSWWVKAVVSTAALGLLVAHFADPDLQIDAVSVGLLVLVLLPWIIDLISSVELPGGTKITFKDVAQAIDKVVAMSAPAQPTAKGVAREEQFLPQTEDSNLVLVGIRVEIERRARHLAARLGVNTDLSATGLLQELNRVGALPSEVFAGLADLVGLGNMAAHGERVEPEAAEWARAKAPELFRVLDAHMEQVEEAHAAH